jgi:hypothetical protein
LEGTSFIDIEPYLEEIGAITNGRAAWLKETDFPAAANFLFAEGKMFPRPRSFRLSYWRTCFEISGRLRGEEELRWEL